jgi:hypothetical protein
MASPDERHIVGVELLSEEPNASIVRLPWRNFPGVVVQGDCLSILVELAEEVHAALKDHSNEEVAGAAEELHATLSGLIAHYEQTLTSAGISLPYVRVERNEEPPSE